MTSSRCRTVPALLLAAGLWTAAPGIRADESGPAGPVLSTLETTTLSGPVGTTGVPSSLDPVLTGIGSGLPPFPSDAIGVRIQMITDLGLVVVQIPPSPTATDVTAVRAPFDSLPPTPSMMPLEPDRSSTLPSVPEPGVLSLALVAVTAAAAMAVRRGQASSERR